MPSTESLQQDDPHAESLAWLAGRLRTESILSRLHQRTGEAVDAHVAAAVSTNA